MIHNSQLHTRRRFNVLVNCALCIAHLFLASCSYETKLQNATPLYDLKNYFEMQVAELKQKNPKVNKLVLQNGLAENKVMQIEDWKAELKPFLETDISKPALRNSFRIDTLEAIPTALHLRYVAVDSSQSIRAIDLQTEQNVVRQVSILKTTGSHLLRSTQSLLWKAGEGYTISGNQTVSMGKDNDYAIKVSFVKD